MDTWRTPHRLPRRVRATLTTVLAVLLMSSCVSTGDDGGTDDSATPQPQGEGSQPDEGEGVGGEAIAASVTSSTNLGQEFRIDVSSLARRDQETLILDLSMVNLSASDEIDVLPVPDPESGEPYHQSLFLIDGVNGKKHYPLLYENGDCYCSDWNETSVAPGESLDIWIAYPAPPQDVDSMTLSSAITPPILDIPIRENASDTGAEPTAPPADPKILDLRSFQDDLDDGSGREESGGEVAISLSTDVLFELNESTLDSTAQEVLEQVAREIDDSSAETVQIDGYTDDSGSDSVNIPLSEERAEAVEQVLSEAVTKTGVAFEVAGHGSQDPIATNETDAGRAKNRRVTITFAK